MLRIAKETDYGVVMLCAIARNPDAQGRTTRAIADETGLPFRMTCKVLHSLVRSGLIVAQRGVKGGYRLAKPASKISLADVIVACEGPIALTECAKDFCDCAVEENCEAKTYWQTINTAFRDSLTHVSLDQMVKQKNIALNAKNKCVH